MIELEEMSKRVGRNKNKKHDVFININMQNGDTGQCWPWRGALNNHDRPYFHIDGKAKAVYRIVYELVKGVELERGQIVRHECDNSQCCNPFHLTIGTHQDNMDDMVERERHGLPHKLVKSIRELYKNGLNGRKVSVKDIAELFDLKLSTTHDIIKGKTYKHLLENKESKI